MEERRGAWFGGGGGLMQLVAYGAHDIFINGTSDLYRSHIEPIKPIKTDKLCNDDCIICFETMKKRELCECKECKLLFHYECIETWLKNHSTCPHCRNNYLSLLNG